MAALWLYIHQVLWLPSKVKLLTTVTTQKATSTPIFSTLFISITAQQYDVEEENATLHNEKHQWTIQLYNSREKNCSRNCLHLSKLFKMASKADYLSTLNIKRGSGHVCPKGCLKYCWDQMYYNETDKIRNYSKIYVCKWKCVFIFTNL